MKKVYLETPEEVIKALKEGKEVFLDGGGAGKVVLIDDFCVKQWNDQFNINYTINLRDKPYILEEEPLKIEVGKFYKTRNGRKAWIVSYEKELNYPYIVAVLGNVETYSILENGYFSSENTSQKDLVAPWEEDN